MLVEDDNSLREIYQARLSAEGYQTVTAKDGEEALSLVGTEKPDLIILDIMMPKISGFDTLDILRSTPATQSTKVIMMSALSQAEDKTRAEKLGANKYLVKSQVTLEDIVKTVKDVLASDDASNGSQDINTSATAAPAASPVQVPIQVAQPEPVAVAPVTAPTVDPAPAPVAVAPDSVATEPDASLATPDATTSDALVTDPVPVSGTPAEPEEEVAPINPVTNAAIAQEDSELNMQSDMSDSASATDNSVAESEAAEVVSSDSVSSDPSPLSTAAPEPVTVAPDPVPAAEEQTTSSDTVPISGNDTIAPPLSSMPTVESAPDPEPTSTGSTDSVDTPHISEPPTPVTDQPVAPTVEAPASEPSSSTNLGGGSKVINPINQAAEDNSSRLAQLIAAEEAKEGTGSDTTTPPATPPVAAA